MGVIGEEHWFIPKFTGLDDPTLLSYVGMSREENRQKLAERFLRPTAWQEYCSRVSPTNCQNDTAAARAPTAEEHKSDGGRFFVPGLYTGHFRTTEKNDYTLNPGNCTGHIFNYPRSWNSNVVPQLYHLNIALESEGNAGGGGYTYGQLVDALRAANATKSDMLIFWWTPKAVRVKFSK
jgi:hypothetical protein